MLFAEQISSNQPPYKFRSNATNLIPKFPEFTGQRISYLVKDKEDAEEHNLKLIAYEKILSVLSRY